MRLNLTQSTSGTDALLCMSHYLFKTDSTRSSSDTDALYRLRTKFLLALSNINDDPHNNNLSLTNLFYNHFFTQP